MCTELQVSLGTSDIESVMTVVTTEFSIFAYVCRKERMRHMAHTVHAPSGGRREKYQTSYGFIVAISKK